MKRILLISGLLAAAIPTAIHADSIGVSFSFAPPGDPLDTELDPSETAGFIPQANWNNMRIGLTNGNKLLSAPMDDSGAATSAELTVHYMSSSETNALIETQPGPDQRIFNYGIFVTPKNSPSTALEGAVTVDKVPYPNYDLYVYVGRPHSSVVDGRVYQFELNGESHFAGEQPGAALDAAGGTYTGFIEATGTDFTAGDANVAIFRDVWGSSFVLQAAASAGRATISGIQIVERPISLEISHDSGADELTFEWPGTDGYVYNLRSHTSLDTAPESWDIFGGLEEIADQGNSTNSVTISMPVDSLRFFALEPTFPSPSSPLFDDFENGIGSWTMGGTTGSTQWELGTPTLVGPVPPGVALPSGTNCIGTDLDADYVDDASIWLRTPEIDLSTFTSGALSFKQFTQMENGFDKGSIVVLRASDNVQLAVIEFGSVNPDSLGVWEDYSVDLPAAAFAAGDNPVKIEFTFESDPFDEAGTYGAGWYMDDVRVSAEP